MRQDLCARHRERHTTHGSQLQKRDSFHAAASLAAVHPPPPPSPLAEPPSAVSPPDGLGTTTYSALSTSAPRVQPPRPHFPLPSPTGTAASYIAASAPRAAPDTPFQPLTPRTSYPPDAAVAANTHPPNDADVKPIYTSASRTDPSSAAFKHLSPQRSSQHIYPSRAQPDGMPYISPQAPRRPIPAGYPPATVHYHPPSNATAAATAATTASTSAATASTTPMDVGLVDPSTNAVIPGSSMADFDPMACAFPVFGGETLTRSPFAMTDDFAVWLFNGNQNTTATNSFGSVPGMINYVDPTPLRGYGQDDPSYMANIVQAHPMSVTSLLDPGPPQSTMSEEKRSELIYLIQERFNETDRAAVKKRKESLLEGDIDADTHVLSLRMMQTYIASFWYHSHDQMPILHQPTFVPDRIPNLLLMAVMTIGAATLDDRQHGFEMTNAASELANFIAWHIRWEIFMDADFRPPAKLWVFQTLLLLELYEKLYSSRALHERAHIHHDTTLTLMRRGSSLIGRSALDSPPTFRDDRRVLGSDPMGTGLPPTPGPPTPDESWSRWINGESTRRAAFAALVLDSTHAVMFGHSAKMVAHEVRLPLPCDEALWAAPTAADAARIERGLNMQGQKMVTFLDALKKTLDGKKVRATPFGRTIIMAGLLSVSWHMNQRDLQVNSLGVAQALGGRDKWKGSLVRAYDNWKWDFDQALIEENSSSNAHHRQQYPNNQDVIFGSRSVLHHLAHMASNVDVVECQIFAGADRLLGRHITPRDYSTARQKMTETWACKTSARDATFYALKFLCQVLLPDPAQVLPADQSAASAYSCSPTGEIDYSARDDFLFNRPWVLYFATLVVWSYGYALDGPIMAPPELATATEQKRDMHAFLERVGSVRTPDDLQYASDRSSCLGLLLVVRHSFSNTKWELLHEAAALLESCIDKLLRR